MYIPMLAALGLAGQVLKRAGTVDSYVATEGPIAQAGLLANIGASGSKSHGAKAGIVIASPSTQNPNYLYTWTRDSALTFKLLADQYTTGVDTSPALRGHIDDYVAAQKILQQVPNPSGNVNTGGLGEPKFNIDETAFTGAWGRPQRDGPALRSIVIMTYANWLLDNGNSSYVKASLWPIIQLDVDYVAQNWNKTTFDLWEEVSSSSFFTTAVQYRALRQGATLASKLMNTAQNATYSTQATKAFAFMQSYWNPTRNYMTANTGGGRSGIDANTVLTSIYMFDKTAGCDATTFQPCSDKALANLLAYFQSFRSIYTINKNAPANGAVATGRYPEDSYYGGNPWYLATAAASEQLYDAVQTWQNTSQVVITSTSLPFFKFLLPGSTLTTQTYAAPSAEYNSIVSAAQALGDGFLGVHAQYTPANGGLAEQYDRNTGTPKSAVDLTWSYAAVLTAIRARGGGGQMSWMAGGMNANC
ncbi:glucoamylase [Dentipellis sp. KUC8613]|nr:glucoamylase [Dentipellis sp. KUC8613]